ncbi:PadR family transcriptional regulator [Polymorphospora rubra]|uniref:PadR family transcriptional regulator n=1 Tax=Polymorphospora rubra TaxID=338584 RepID=UPI0033EEF8E2
MDQERRAQWLRGVLDLCVLAMVARRESYGYELSQALEAAGLGPVKGGTLYPVLLRLQRAGLIVAYWREGGAGPARKYYRITGDGHDVLRQAAADWDRFAGGVGAILREVPAR